MQIQICQYLRVRTYLNMANNQQTSIVVCFDETTLYTDSNISTKIRDFFQKLIFKDFFIN